MKNKLITAATFAAVLAGAAWLNAQAPTSTIANAPPFDGTTLALTASGIYQLGSSLGISVNSANSIAFGNGAAGDASGTIRFNAATNGLNTARVVWNVQSGADIAFMANSTYRADINAGGVQLTNTNTLGWGSGNISAGATLDTAIARDSAGVVQINNGSSNSGGGLKIPGLKSTTGTRFLCIDTAGLISSSASACSGT